MLKYSLTTVMTSFLHLDLKLKLPLVVLWTCLGSSLLCFMKLFHLTIYPASKNLYRKEEKHYYNENIGTLKMCTWKSVYNTARNYISALKHLVQCILIMIICY